MTTEIGDVVMILVGVYEGKIGIVEERGRYWLLVRISEDKNIHRFHSPHEVSNLSLVKRTEMEDFL